MNHKKQLSLLLPVLLVTPVYVVPNSKQYAKKAPKIVNLTPPPAQAPIRDSKKDALLKKTIRDMTLADLREVIPYAKELQLTDLLIKYTERILVLATDPQELCDMRFQLAELYFEQKNMKKAGKLYREYSTFYPGTDRCDDAERKEILTKFYMRNIPPRDMKKTHKTIALANRYLEHSPRIVRAYKKEIESIRTTCYQELFEYDVYVINHYLIKGSLVAARTRLENSRQEILPHLSEVEPRIIEFEGIIAQRAGDEKLLAQTLQTLKERFPTYRPTILVANLNKKLSYVDIF